MQFMAPVMPNWQLTVKAQPSADIPPTNPVEEDLDGQDSDLITLLQAISDLGYDVQARLVFASSTGQTVEVEHDLTPTPPGP